MSTHNAIIFDFPDGTNTILAYQLLFELGYEPVRHSHTRLHIHIEAKDIRTAIEISLTYGGQLVDQEPITDQLVANTAYSTEDIMIPAHLVNEDIIAQDEASLSDEDISQFNHTSAYRAYDN